MTYDQSVHYRLHGVDLNLAEDVPAWPRSATQAATAWEVRVDHVGAELVASKLVRAGSPQWHWHGEPSSPEGEATLTITGGPGEGSATRYVVNWPDRTINVTYTHAASDGWDGVVELLSRWVVPMIARAATEDLPLHATTVRLNGRAVLIAGPSGAGKSTLTAALLNTGAELLGDEPAVVQASRGRLSVWPGEASIRLHEPLTSAPEVPTSLATFELLHPDVPNLDPPRASEAPAGTHRVGTRFGKSVFHSTASHSGDEPIPVLALCLLSPRHADGQPTINVLPPDAAFTRVMSERYSFPGRPAAVRSDFATTARVASTGRVVDLHLPDKLDRVPVVASTLWDVLQGAVE